MEEAHKTMVKYLDYGLLNGHTLHLLANVLNKVRDKVFERKPIERFRLGL